MHESLNRKNCNDARMCGESGSLETPNAAAAAGSQSRRGPSAIGRVRVKVRGSAAETAPQLHGSVTGVKKREARLLLLSDGFLLAWERGKQKAAWMLSGAVSRAEEELSRRTLAKVDPLPAGLGTVEKHTILCLARDGGTTLGTTTGLLWGTGRASSMLMPCFLDFLLRGCCVEGGVV